MPNTLMKAADFAAKLREKLPELSEFNDTQIINKILELRPDLTDKVENPLSGDMVAAKEQARTLEKADRDKDFTRSVMSALPATGAILGGTMGPMASALGAGVGRGAMDLGNQFLGLDNSSPLEKAKNIGVDMGITALTPGAMEFAKNPIQSSRIGAKMLSGLEDSFIPNRLKPFIKPPFLEDFANGGKPKFDPLVRPTNMNVAANIAEGSPKPTNKPKFSFSNGNYTNKQTGEIINNTKGKIDDVINGLMKPTEETNIISKSVRPEPTVSPKFNPRNQTGMTGSTQTTKGVAPNMRAKIMRGMHDPVDVFFDDPESREIFGGGQSPFNKGISDPNKVARFNSTVKRVTEKYGIPEVASRKLVGAYNDKIRALASSMPKVAESGIVGDLNFKAPSFESFMNSFGN